MRSGGNSFDYFFAKKLANLVQFKRVLVLSRGFEGCAPSAPLSTPLVSHLKKTLCFRREVRARTSTHFIP